MSETIFKVGDTGITIGGQEYIVVEVLPSVVKAKVAGNNIRSYNSSGCILPNDTHEKDLRSPTGNISNNPHPLVDSGLHSGFDAFKQKVEIYRLYAEYEAAQKKKTELRQKLELMNEKLQKVWQDLQATSEKQEELRLKIESKKEKLQKDWKDLLTILAKEAGINNYPWPLYPL